MTVTSIAMLARRLAQSRGSAARLAANAQGDLFPESAPRAVRAFHGTYERFGEFSPWQHFGTRRAALDRLASKGDDYGRLPGPRRVIPVEIDGKRVDIGPEWHASGGATRMSDVAEMLAKHGHLTREELSLALAPLESGGRYLGREAQEVVAERLAEMLRKKQIAAIGYRNRFEDPGSVSYIVPDPSVVRRLR